MMRKAEVEITDEFMVPMEVQSFTTGSPFPADVFMRLHADKYIQLGKKGQICRFNELHAIKDKKVNNVFVHQGEFKEFVKQSLLKFEVMSATDFASPVTVSHLHQTAELVIKQIQYIGVSKESIEAARLLTKSIREIAKNCPSVLLLMGLFEHLPGNLVHHAMTVSALSVMVAERLGWATDALLEKLSLGGLLHDIGLLKMPEGLLKKSFEEMTVEERAIYETHPYLGAQMLRGSSNLQAEIISIVYEHHEVSSGGGYPRAIDDSRINPLSKVVGLTDKFTELILPQIPGEQAFSPIQALDYIENVLGQPYNADCFKAFRSIFGK